MSTRALALVVGLFISAAAPVVAGFGRKCQHCGCESGVSRRCVLKCEKKKVPETKYSTECEEFCVPNASTQCTQCPADTCGHSKKTFWYLPTSASLFVRTKLVKKTEDKEQLIYTWVLETLCEECQMKANAPR